MIAGFCPALFRRGFDVLLGCRALFPLILFILTAKTLSFFFRLAKTSLFARIF